MRAALVLSLLLGTLPVLSQHHHHHHDEKTEKPLGAEDMLSAPRPQAPIPSPDGHNAINVVDRWSPTDDITTRSVYILSLKSNASSSHIDLFDCHPSEASELFWISNGTIAYLNGSSLYSLPIENKVKPKFELEFPAGINAGGLKYSVSSGVLAFSAQVWADGSFDTVAHFDDVQSGQRDTGRVFDELYVRHWDIWRTPGKVWTIGTTKLGKDTQFKNVLNGTGLYSQIDPIEFDLSSTHIAISVKAPHLPPAQHTRTDIYLIPLGDTKSSPSHLTPHAHGAIGGVTFSPKGDKLAWLEMAKDGYESDKRVAVTYDLSSKRTTRWTDGWDRSPSDITWALGSDSLYFLAEHHGRILPYHLSHPDHLPTPLLFNHSTSSLATLTRHTLLLSISSMTSPADIFLLHLDQKDDGDKLPRSPLHRLTSWSKDYIDGRLDSLVIEEFWFKGAEDWDIMSWIIKPRNWQPDQISKYPLAFLIHGGPQGAWEDSWSTRWNPALFASQGYFVIAINPTGSTGYGQEFTDRIQSNWGGRPFKDLVAGYHSLLACYPEVDPQRTAALGASYGGYMINWINGHNDAFGSGFKALVCHDGIFDTLTMFYTTEEVYFPIHDLVGTPIDARATYERWNPMNHVSEWTTPQLVIHSALDYRLVDGQGFAPFTALQVQGVPSRLLWFPDENHWVLKPHNSVRWHYEVFRWLDEWVGEKPDALVIQ
ncbi:putative peptidase [Naematelia encephala]|uniref:Dipeptidyl-peptidase V n=1 Tax=Naematelia encephala TaxID=71784 RepID=A0A1Y2AU66_9TREE|nr:putative peptidase [Naematelia encephala]